MLPTDRERFARCLMAAAELYGKTVSDALAELWWRALRNYDIQAVEHAFSQHFVSPDSGQFMPKPADIVRIVGGTSVDGAMVAWAKFDRAVRQVGPYCSVTFDDPLIHLVVHDMGGWIAFSTKTEDEWPFIGNQFRTRYIGYRQRGEVPEYPRKLIGITDAENVKNGFPVGQPALIGDASKAKAVLQGGTDAPLLGVTRTFNDVVVPMLPRQSKDAA